MAKTDTLTSSEMQALAEYCADYSKDPYGFVVTAFPWGEKGTSLENQKGPDKWQESLLKRISAHLNNKEIGDANKIIREAFSSGHGIGKSTIASWLMLWSIATFEDTRGIVTANTSIQLTTKTWAELAKWYHLSIVKPMFVWTATSLYSSQEGHEKTWRIDAISWSIDNTEAFAGLHNQGKRILIIFDEASAINNKIWEVTEGAMTDSDTEIFWFCFGNPTKLNGAFYDCFNLRKHRWTHTVIDSRDAKMSNKQLIKEWEEDWGEDSDFFRVRVRGLFPRSNDEQLIPSGLVTQAMKSYMGEPTKADKESAVVFGVDPAWTGGDLTVCYMRQGNYSKVLFALPRNDDDTLIAGKLALLSDEYDMTKGFIDLGYGQGIYSVLKSMGREDKWSLVSFASSPTSEAVIMGESTTSVKFYENKRAEMWFEMKAWLKKGGTIENNNQIFSELTSPQAFVNPRNGKLILESKKDMKARGVSSPNYGDALSLTFAEPVIIGGANFSWIKKKYNTVKKKYGGL